LAIRNLRSISGNFKFKNGRIVLNTVFLFNEKNIWAFSRYASYRWAFSLAEKILSYQYVWWCAYKKVLAFHNIFHSSRNKIPQTTLNGLSRYGPTTTFSLGTNPHMFHIGTTVVFLFQFQLFSKAREYADPI
jgi:hypothetical protein